MYSCPGHCRIDNRGRPLVDCQIGRRAACCAKTIDPSRRSREPDRFATVARTKRDRIVEPAAISQIDTICGWCGSTFRTNKAFSTSRSLSLLTVNCVTWGSTSVARWWERCW